MRLIKADLLHGYGDPKYKNAINIDTRMTKILGLNLFPTRIWFRDSVIVIKKVMEFLLYIENINRNIIYISEQPIECEGGYTYFSDIISNLQIP
jgi:hypothetical protein